MRIMNTILLAIGLGLATPSFADVAMIKTSPGYYRMMLGDFEITALSDGTVALPVDQLLTNTTSEQVNQSLARHHLHSPLETSVNAYLINTGEKLVLIDTGTSNLFGPTLGQLPEHLQAAGYKAKQIDEIYITHLHPDHFGGLMQKGKAVFPNAIIRVDQHDIDYWLSQENLDQAADDAKSGFQSAQAAFAPYLKANKVKPFSGDSQLLPGIKAMANYGHTPGHSVYMVESNGARLLLWGDLMHVAAVQFPKPEITISFDSDANAAAAQRQQVFADAAQHGYLIGGAHISFPGIGRLIQQDSGYRWLPVNYSPVTPD